MYGAVAPFAGGRNHRGDWALDRALPVFGTPHTPHVGQFGHICIYSARPVTRNPDMQFRLELLIEKYCVPHQLQYISYIQRSICEQE